MASQSSNEFEERFERLYTVLRFSNTQLVPMSRFMKILFETGLRPTDPRLSKFFQYLRRHLHKHSPSVASNLEYAATSGDEDEMHAYETIQLTKQEFHDSIKAEAETIFRAITGQFIIPDFGPFAQVMQELYEACCDNRDGKVASYIPPLARTNPDLWAVSVCTVDGQRFSIGNSRVPFCMQAVSKALNYAIALSDFDAEQVHQHVGREPSGRSFNALSLDQHQKPHNPMINSGAIATVSLLKTTLQMADRFDYILHKYKRMAAHEYVSFSNSTFLSERDVSARNFAIAYYMQENRVFPKNAKIKDTLDLYFQLCSVEITTDSAAVMAGTLANGGICPLTGDAVLRGEAVSQCLSLMYSCGMYDYSGQFAFSVGVPAKSGASGAILIVIPDVMGICVWSPPLDENGNSVRGIQFSTELVKRFNFHHYDTLTLTSKYDPRRTECMNKAHDVVALLTNAANGDVSALRRFHNKYGNAAMTLADYDGRTALHLGAAEGHFEVVKFLLRKCNIDPNAVDRFGGTPLDDAQRHAHDDIVELLRKYGAKEAAKQ